MYIATCYDFGDLLFAFCLGKGWMLMWIYIWVSENRKPKRIQTANGITTVEPKVVRLSLQRCRPGPLRLLSDQTKA